MTARLPSGFIAPCLPCGFDEDRNAAEARHFAAHPEDRDANVVIFKFCDDEEMADS
ncbi:MAG: hypothetical protein WBL48_07065 [Pseudolabrys sp.]